MAGGQPVFIVDPKKEQTKGKDSLSMNIAAAKAVASIVKSTLGPRGMDKMLVNPLGDITITNDGATILKDMDIEHPAAKMVVEVAESLENSAGDGTTSSVVFTGALLEKAEELIERGVHPTIVIKGYRLAASKAVEVLEGLAISVGEEEEAMLRKAAETAITGKATQKYNSLIAKLASDAILAIQERGIADIKRIQISKEVGGRIEDSEFVEGVVLEKVALDRNFPLKIEAAKIALLDTPMEVGKTANKSKLQITSVEQMGLFVEEEEKSLLEMADYILKAGANAVFCGKGVDDRIAEYLQSRGIFVTRRVPAEPLQQISKATGARIVRNIKELEAKDLGSAGLLEQEREGDQGKTYLRDCADPKAVSIIIRGGTEHVIDNVERALDDALWVVKSVFEDGKVVAGGGATEIEVALALRNLAAGIRGREQLSFLAFADALEEIPRTIARNAGLDSIDSVLNLRAKHTEDKNAGLNVFTGKAENMLDEGVIDPLRVKLNSVKAGSEAAEMVLKVDSMLRAQRQAIQDVKPEHRASSYDAMAPGPNMF